MSKSKKLLAKPKKPKGFQKGHKSGGTITRGVAQATVHQVVTKKIDAAVITGYITLNSHLNLAEINARLKDPNISVLERAICVELKSIAVNGGKDSLNFFFDRLIGKVPQKMQFEKADPFEGKTVEELIQMKRDLEGVARSSLELEIAHNARAQTQIKELTQDIEAQKQINNLEEKLNDVNIYGESKATDTN